MGDSSDEEPPAASEESPPKEEPRWITEEELARHGEPRDCWIAIRGLVYDVTAFLENHPGGGDIISLCAGRDATDDFDECQHSDAAMLMMGPLCIGRLLKDETPSRRKNECAAPLPPAWRPKDFWWTAAGVGVVAIALIIWRQRK